MFVPCQESAHELDLRKEVPAAYWLLEREQVLGILIGMAGGGGQG